MITDCFNVEEEEEEEEECRGEGEGGQPSLDCYQPSGYLAERAEDWLIADDPALFSDEFSDPEEWADTFN